MTEQPSFVLDTDRRAHDSAKWRWFDEDVLPLWVADMDFCSPQAVVDALTDRVALGSFGYTMTPDSLQQTIVERMQARYDWAITPQMLCFVPGMVASLNVATHALGHPGDGVLMQTPVYSPFLKIPATNQQYAVRVDLVPVYGDDNTIRYTVDFDALEAAITPPDAAVYAVQPA